MEKKYPPITNIRKEKKPVDFSKLSQTFLLVVNAGKIPGIMYTDGGGNPVCDQEGKVMWDLYLPLHVVESYWIDNGIYTEEQAKDEIANFLEVSRVMGCDPRIAGSKRVM